MMEEVKNKKEEELKKDASKKEGKDKATDEKKEQDHGPCCGVCGG